MAKAKKVVFGRKVIKTDTYTLIRKTYDDGNNTIERTCDGFNPLELLGMLEIIQTDIIGQIRGQVPPPKIIKKTFIERKK